ncbi:hypothetical protein PIB30_109472, partial [Stylosanthes scabra]|nr:hypothetical protein [Stylosanthes scabra]
EKWILDEMELTSSGSSGGGGSEIPLISFPSDIIESLPYSAVWFMMDRTELCLISPHFTSFRAAAVCVFAELSSRPFTSPPVLQSNSARNDIDPQPHQPGATTAPTARRGSISIRSVLAANLAPTCKFFFSVLYFSNSF